MKILKVKIVMILCFLFLIHYSSNSQSDSTRLFTTTYKFCGIEFTYPNYNGEIDSEAKIIDFNNRSALISYTSKLNYGIQYSTQKTFKNSPRLSLIPEIGINFIMGRVELRKYSGLLVGSNIIFEDQLDINFRNLFLYSAYGLQYELSKVHELGIFIAPKISIRVLSKGDVVIDKYTVDYDQSPVEREFNDNQEVKSGYDLAGVQSFIEVGFNKSFPIKNNVLRFGIEYELSLFDVYSPVNFRSHPISITIKYGFAQSNE